MDVPCRGIAQMCSNRLLLLGTMASANQADWHNTNDLHLRSHYAIGIRI